MAKIYILIAFLPHLLYAIVQSRQSLCSQYFTYMTKPGITDMLGQIEIPPPSANDMFYLKVALSTPTELSQVVRLELARSIKESVRRVYQGRPLLYHVYYPMNEQIPSLSAIWFNGHRYCPDPIVYENITANVELGHILSAPNEEPLVYGLWQEISQPYHRNSTNYRIDNLSYDRLNHYSGLNECGITSYYTDDTNRLIPDGEKSLPGQWPWVVAIYEKHYEGRYVSRCAGTLITTRHVLTHKWCIVLHRGSSMRFMEPQELWVLFGLSNSGAWNGSNTGIINRAVVYHTTLPSGPDYQLDTFGLAILHLKKTVEYNAFIRPICLWSGTTNSQDMINMTGYLVGWGFDYAKNESVHIQWKYYRGKQRMAKAPLLNVTVDTSTKYQLGYLYPVVHPGNIFCPDFGSGLVIFNTTMGRYQLRGIMLDCTLGGFSDLAGLTSWIQEHIERKLWYL